MTDFERKTDAYRQMTEDYLNGLFTDTSLPQKLIFEAMRYSLLAGGKRIRPVLTLEFCHACGGRAEDALALAAAMEMVHTYSLIHDDLPCMDNDDYRRGKLTNHKVYGEAQAVLAGDGLLTAAFSEAAKAPIPAERIVRAVSLLSENAGVLGMIGGQVLDIDGEGKQLTEQQVYTIHRLKTGALIRCACQLGAIAAGADEKTLENVRIYADALGLAFQIRDDMLDVLGDEKKLGKKTGMDEDKTTFVTLYGLEKCGKLIDEQTRIAAQAVSGFADCAYLTEFANRLAVRDY